MSALASGLAFTVRLVTGVRPVVPRADGDPGSVLALPRGAVFFANHSSHLDFLTVWAVLPGELRRRARPVAAADYWGSGARGRLLRHLFNPLLVERGRKRPQTAGDRPPGQKKASQVDRLVAALDAGDSLILFPEGTRGDGERIADFQAGLARIGAARPEAPLVPVALANLGRILPKGSMVPVPVLATATFLPPVRRAADEAEDAFLARARGVLVAALAEPGERPGEGER